MRTTSVPSTSRADELLGNPDARLVAAVIGPSLGRRPLTGCAGESVAAPARQWLRRPVIGCADRSVAAPGGLPPGRGSRAAVAYARGYPAPQYVACLPIARYGQSAIPIR